MAVNIKDKVSSAANRYGERVQTAMNNLRELDKEQREYFERLLEDAERIQGVADTARGLQIERDSLVRELEKYASRHRDAEIELQRSRDELQRQSLRLNDLSAQLASEQELRSRADEEIRGLQQEIDKLHAGAKPDGKRFGPETPTNDNPPATSHRGLWRWFDRSRAAAIVISICIAWGIAAWLSSLPSVTTGLSRIVLAAGIY